ncbi:MAG: hypothetical protein ACI4UB_07365 [Limosilactobacillus sp.]
MLRKQLHETYMVTITEFLNNWEYLIKANDKAQKTITLKKGNEIIAVLLTSNTFQKTDSDVEKLEAMHRTDQLQIKALRKENEILKARLDLLEKANKTDDKDIPF